jgi:ATP-dependent exoDNAse (exonuclease V) alpha subunit
LNAFTFIEQNDPAAIVDLIVALCCRHIPDQLGIDGARDVQVLSPMHKGLVGTVNLNRRLQKELNPGKGGLKFNGATFGSGDKVMQRRNNHQKEVFNGAIGIVSAIQKGQGSQSRACRVCGRFTASAPLAAGLEAEKQGLCVSGLIRIDLLISVGIRIKRR